MQLLRSCAVSNSKGSMVVSALSVAAWFMGVYAVHLPSGALYLITAPVNLSLAIAIALFHTAGNARARQLLTKLFCWCRKNAGKD